MMNTDLLNHHVVDVETGKSVAAFIDRFIADMWALEYEQKTKRKLRVYSID